MNYIVNYQESSNIVLIAPGYNGSATGYLEKYNLIAKHLNDKGVATVQMDNYINCQLPKSYNIERAIAFIQENALNICGKETYKLHVFAHSFSAAQITKIGCYFSEIKQIILTDPQYNDGKRAQLDGIKNLKLKNVDIFCVICIPKKLEKYRQFALENWAKELGATEIQVDLTSFDHDFSSEEAFRYFRKLTDLFTFD